MVLPPFRLYGLLGCPHCAQAEQFLRSRQCPVITIIANDDPIASAGILSLTGQTNYPVMCYTPLKEIVKGFEEGVYDRLVKAYHAAAGAGAFDVSPGEQQSQLKAEALSAEATTGAV